MAPPALALGRILRLDHRQFFVRVVAEHILEDCVEARRILHNAICRSTFVKDWHSRSIEFRVLKMYLSMNSPKISRVSVFSLLKMGVPVKPMMAALWQGLAQVAV